jgi:hypothetical protein
MAPLYGMPPDPRPRKGTPEAIILEQLESFKALREQAAANASFAISTEPENKPSTAAPKQDAKPNQTSKEKHAMPATITTHAKAALRARKPRAKSKPNTASAHRSSLAAAHLAEAASEPSFERHSRKCKICSHPDREAIEELFINWHSAEDIRALFAIYHPFDWSAIYRHARAAGLYPKRRKNLRAVLDLLLEGVTSVPPTAHGVIAAVRAYSCLTEANNWVEPEKRVCITNHVYRHDLPACPDKGRAEAGISACPDEGRINAPSSSTVSATSSPAPPAEAVSVVAASEPVSTYRSSTGTATHLSGSSLTTDHCPLPFPNRQTSKLESPPTRT